MPRDRMSRLFGPALALGLLAMAGSAHALDCDSERDGLFIPKGYMITDVEYMQAQDATAQATLWSQRFGPRTTDNIKTGLPKGAWQTVGIVDPAQFQLNPRKDWHMGVSALYSEGGEPSKPFECVTHELHANGADPYGYYIVNYIPHESDPGQIDFQVKVTLHKGPVRTPKPARKGFHLLP